MLCSACKRAWRSVSALFYRGCSACARQVSELWTQATEVEKAPYNALASIDFVRYQSELEAYNYRCRDMPACSVCWLCCGKVLKTCHCLSLPRTALLHSTSFSPRSEALMASQTHCRRIYFRKGIAAAANP